MENNNISSFENFEAAVQGVLQLLHDRIGFQLWMFTRVKGKDWIVLEASDHGYGVKSGDVFNWSDSFCSRMVEGLGPRIAPRSKDIAAYVEAPIGRQVPISAYIGIPLCHLDGTLFGTLCAIDPNPQPDKLIEEAKLIELQTKLLTTILHYQLKAEEIKRRCERSEAEAQIDILTGIYNRRGWENLLMAEELRCKRYGHSASVIVIDLDNLKQVNDKDGHAAGDRLLQTAVACMCENVRQGDIIARLGGDEFGILMVEITTEETEKMALTIECKLEQQGVKASMGWQQRSPQSTLPLTVVMADQAMYRQKAKRKQLTQSNRN